MDNGFKAESILAQLKDFQRATVDHAFHRLFEAPDSTRRFLVADEVGLGKTLVAGGVTAKAIEHLRAKGVERIDIVYICSNGDIAAQNVRKLDVGGTGAAIASRLTLLAQEVHDLRARPLNVVALTPGTSFEQASATGKAKERVLLYSLLREAWELGNVAGPKNVLQATTRKAKTFRSALSTFDRGSIDPEIEREFARALERREQEERAAGEQTIRERFDVLCNEFSRTRKNIPSEQRQRRNRIISELRGLLAASCVEALEPDLVILDEFQRFKHLLVDDPDSEAASLARALFTWERPETNEHARVLLLSATPYRALTVAGDGGEDDHHEDFLATVQFLADSPERRAELGELLRRYQRELYAAAPEASGRLAEVGAQIGDLLARYIARTERIGAAGQHDAMLRQIVRTPAPQVDDLRQYMLVQDLADILDQPDITELWKSVPYLINFLDGYQLRARFDAERKSPEGARELAAAFSGYEHLLLDGDVLEEYEAVDPGGPRLRELAKDVIDSEAWRLLWVPPTMPYHELGGAYARPELAAFTKRLVFSAWRAVPRAAAGLLSYLADRRLTLEADESAKNTPQRRAAQRNRLAFTIDARGRRTGMPALALIYPSSSLARAADPRLFATTAHGASIDDVLEWARAQLRPLLARLPNGASAEVDERWYWAAPLILDSDESQDWWSRADLAESWTKDDKRATAEGSRWTEHVELAHEAVRGTLDPPLGAQPADLEDVLARIALGAPGTLALRALTRVTGLDPADLACRLPAAQIAWGLRGLFNSPEATALLRASRTETFWRDVLRYSIDGDLQSVLDEHAHVLLEVEGLQDKPAAKAAKTIADAMGRALGLRASGVSYSDISVERHKLTVERVRLHTAYAMRFGDEESGDRASGATPARAPQLREAFNSPYWPFVLVSTSVGQEGLDFHPYCHAVVHWNLPTNPVDLEQREGRVHRYKGHAIRKNVALAHGPAALAAQGDPWAHAFDLAAEDRQAEDNELVPYWIYPLEEGAKVERHVLALPLSRELDRLTALRNALAVYRLAFGQARQEDIIDHLLTRLGPERAASLAAQVRIDLRPPPRAESRLDGQRPYSAARL